MILKYSSVTLWSLASIKGVVMICPVCGRGMVDRITHYACPNILCDYVEEIEYAGEYESRMKILTLSLIRL